MPKTVITVEWPAVPDVPGYDLYENGTKVSSTTSTSAKFGVTNGMAVKIVPQAIPAPPPPPPPAPTGKLWGISPSNNGGFNPSIDTQMAEYVKLGVTCPRIPGDDTSALSARNHGFKTWVAWVSGDGSASVSSLVAYAQKYPEAVVVGFGNELNLNSSWTVSAVAAKQIQFYNAMKAVGLEHRVGLSCVGNSPSRVEGLLPLDWCRHLRSLGCVNGTGFTTADYHMYAADPQNYDNWMHVWTPDSTGESCQSVLGHPGFVVSEFGAKIGKDVSDETSQANAVTAWVSKLNSLPECLGAHWFQAFDGSAWVGYGLIRSDGTHRPSYAAYQAAVA